MPYTLWFKSSCCVSFIGCPVGCCSRQIPKAMLTEKSSFQTCYISSVCTSQCAAPLPSTSIPFTLHLPLFPFSHKCSWMHSLRARHVIKCENAEDTWVILASVCMLYNETHHLGKTTYFHSDHKSWIIQRCLCGFGDRHVDEAKPCSRTVRSSRRVHTQ